MLWRVVLVSALLVVSYASLAPSSGGAMFAGADKLAHCLIYAVLYVLAWLAFPGAVLRWYIHIGLLGFGVALELLQAQTGYRFMEGADVLANSTGTGLGNLMLSFFHAGVSKRLNSVSAMGESVK
jgi:glycopeptide antibiotics resistance protein